MNKEIKEKLAWAWLIVVATAILYFAATSGWLIRLGIGIAVVVVVIATVVSISIILDKDDDEDYL